MADAWIKNLGDRIYVAKKIARNRERNLLELESQEQKLSRDLREVSMCEGEVKEKEVQVDRLKEELMRKIEKLSLEKVALKVKREGLVKKRDELFVVARQRRHRQGGSCRVYITAKAGAPCRETTPRRAYHESSSPRRY